MITETPIIETLIFEAFNEGTAKWEAWTGDLNSLSIQRGGQRNGVQVTVEPGLLNAVLINAGDPLIDNRLKPNTRVRVGVLVSGKFEPIFTGRISDLLMTHTLDKSRNVTTTRVAILATDSVTAHAGTTRYGAISDPETWALRIRRLSESAITNVVLPADDSPVVRYAI